MELSPVTIHSHNRLLSDWPRTTSAIAVRMLATSSYFIHAVSARGVSKCLPNIVETFAPQSLPTRTIMLEGVKCARSDPYEIVVQSYLPRRAEVSCQTALRRPQIGCVSRT